MAGSRNILLIRPRFLGDLVLATGLPRAIKAADPGARVSILAEGSYAPALHHHPDLDGVVGFDASRKDDPFYLLDFQRGLRRKRYDAVLDLFGNPRTAQMAFFSGAPLRVGFDLRGRAWAYNRLAFPSSPALPSGRRPVTEAYLDQVRALGLPVPGTYRTSLHVTDEEKAHARKLLGRAGLAAGQRLAVLAPGASWPAKHWPLAKFARLGAYLSAEGFRILTVFGPKERGLAGDFQGMMGKDWILIQEPSLRGLMAFIEAADLLISNDAGPMHVGPAVGTPTLGVFGPGEPEVWFPYGAPHRVLYAEVPCSHCGLDACPLMACMDALTPEAAAQAAVAMTDPRPPKSR